MFLVGDDGRVGFLKDLLCGEEALFFSVPLSELLELARYSPSLSARPFLLARCTGWRNVQESVGGSPALPFLDYWYKSNGVAFDNEAFSARRIKIPLSVTCGLGPMCIVLMETIPYWNFWLGWVVDDFWGWWVVFWFFCFLFLFVFFWLPPCILWVYFFSAYGCNVYIYFLWLIFFFLLYAPGKWFSPSFWHSLCFFDLL